MTALGQKEPEKERDTTADDRDDDFRSYRPLRGKKRPDRGGKHNREVNVATDKDEFLCEWEIMMREGTRFSIIRMTEELTVDNKVHHDSKDNIRDAHNKARYEVYFQGEEEDHGNSKQSIGHHIIFCGILAVFWGLILRKRPTRRASAVEGISELTEEKDDEPHTNIGACKS